ncbi:MAG: hypothetical protein K6F48_08000 [Paludibacteraceae bacterium]|nr:hypothetical protein [Paludibacteraceae bacterium]
MNKLLRYLGIIIILIGVLLLMFHFFGVIGGNGILAIAGIMFVLGLIAYIICNKYFLND